MSRSSIFMTIVLVVLTCSLSTFAQERKHWSLGGTVGTINELSVSYDLTSQLQLSVGYRPIAIGEGETLSPDRIALSAVYYFGTSDRSLFIGITGGSDNQSASALVATIPFGIQEKVSDDLRIRLAVLGVRDIDNNRSHSTGLGLLLGVSVYL